ncbi:preprotein translocase subunit YajC [Pseudobacteriovorax antillogorgiicola]|uniref:Sec translocon accessory complex subunit YajC n=1 Tax=Pseudobacteriovorax antillogorgiicola TaxID=1513793 RepID=A0A1Y6B448_9BACT|nr:preprotein translocase subunit YajC [Pseudobacteriovorax antillogorgiicola]TCS59180.1 protein translocase subunit yajC [Pseudobacteriovorax antillogorgiicola]SME90848.1 protein translocase subunit yajC [Pseudobacteriovorax antillogorgiicola]
MINNLFVGTALAQGKAAAEPSMLELLAMPAMILVIMYLFMIRPQQKKQKEHQELLQNLKSGDEVVTTGGIIGRIKAVSDAFVTIDAGANNQLKIQKHHVVSLSPKAAAKK